MKILGLDSSGLVASVCLMEDDTLLAEYSVNHKKTHSQTLLPMLDEIVKMVEADLSEIDAIAVAAGPGSFTGLRIGSATVKGLAFALNKPVVSVPTTAGIAANLFNTEGLICPIMDARRSQVYTGTYCFKDGKMITLTEQRAMSIEELIEELNEKGETVTFLGDGVQVYKNVIEEKIKVPYFFAPAHLSKQRAGAVAYVGMQLFKEGKYEDGKDHTPVYLRLSQAERERLEQEKNADKKA
ncbi:MAG: tRNA (adenosine(37)-N6)-threonylcarbamoyltransferase complex dimerization subunit type 1 TsaB [Lachnospiraceae bacterium]|nr:tRNA (adenosine(37)-N6)-threonylcarbamoyltransferase complex dimerization subunit type 1 TsaB [Lachnospiraceae bacterium]